MLEQRFYGPLFRIKSISEDGHLLHAVSRSGDLTTISRLEAPLNFYVGDVIEVRETVAGKELHLVPADLWPEEGRIAVVVHFDDDITILELDLRLTQVRTRPGVRYAVGNTVLLVGDRVERVIATSSLTRRSLDGPSVDPVALFERNLGQSELSFSSFGGSAAIVDQARDLLEISLRRREDLIAIGSRPIKGVLFAGPPGTGKTHLARILASESGASFFEISGPQVFSKWFGESEQLLRDLFKEAQRRGRALIFFDEIDSVASRRQEHSHEASKRVVAQLLTLMDGFAPETNVIVIAATNRPQDLDDALLRPGRFDWRVQFDLPGREDRLSILTTSGQNYKQSLSNDLWAIADKTDGWSPAELASIWVEAAHAAVKDGRLRISSEDLLIGQEAAEGQRSAVMGWITR